MWDGRIPLLLLMSLLGRVEDLQRLLKGGADVDEHDAMERRALHLASNGAVAKELLSRGAKPSCRDANGWTPMEYAEWLRRSDVVDVLRKVAQM